MNEIITLPKGTLIKVNGCSLELLQDIEVKGSLVNDNNTNSPSEPFNNDGGAMEEYPAVLCLN